MRSLFFATLLLAFINLVACTKQDKQSAEPTKMTAREAMGLVANDFGIIVDVREKEEIDQDGVAAPAKWLPLSTIEKDGEALNKLVQGLSKDKQVVFYCISGARAETAAKKLSGLGYKTGYFTGIYEWTKAGLPTRPL